MAKDTGRHVPVGGGPTVGGRETHGAGQEGLESLAQAQDEPAKIQAPPAGDRRHGRVASGSHTGGGDLLRQRRERVRSLHR
jgi:hypothetical protein